MQNLSSLKSGFLLWISEMVKQCCIVKDDIQKVETGDEIVRTSDSIHWEASYNTCIYLQDAHTHRHTHTETRILYFKNDAGVRLRLTAVEYYPLSEVAAYLQEWHTVVEAQPANCMETMQHVEWYFFTCSVSIASLRGLRLTAGWWTESSVPGPHEWGHLVNLNIEPWIVSISCNVTDVTSLQWVLE